MTVVEGPKMKWTSFLGSETSTTRSAQADAERAGQECGTLSKRLGLTL